MKTYNNLYAGLCSTQNLQLAFTKARQGKTAKSYVKEFEENLNEELDSLKKSLENLSYRPAPLTTFIVRDPKTRKISVSHFRDRVVHHALCNIIGPIFQARFIHDSFANQVGKGTHKAILRYEQFQRKVGPHGFALKADIQHYFDTVDHETLTRIIASKITDPQVLQLIKTIISNHPQETPGQGMPIGNLTSQFFANIYLDKLDQFVKHELKVKFYIRYVDDFVILHKSRKQLEEWKERINEFLTSELKLQLHPDKSRVLPIRDGVTLLGFRVFGTHRLLKKSNQRRIWSRADRMISAFQNHTLGMATIWVRLQGWMAYACFGATYKLRQRIVNYLQVNLAYGKSD